MKPAMRQCLRIVRPAPRPSGARQAAAPPPTPHLASNRPGARVGQPAADHGAERRRLFGAPVLLALLCVLGLAAAAAAQQHVYAVSPRVIFLPQDGVALDAATGRVQWRVPRFEGPVFTDGRGLVIFSYLAGINDIFHFHQYRFCRLRADNGKKIWCFLTSHLHDATLSAGGDFLYVRRREALDVYAVATGRRQRSFDLADFDGAEMMAMPDDGVAVFVASRRQSRLLTVYPRGPTPLARVRSFDRPLYAFHGPGPGVLWYAPDVGRFVSIADPKQPPFAAPMARQSFPRVLANGNGFLIELRQGGGWTLTGGLYHGSLWMRSLPEQASVFLAGATGLSLAPLAAAGPSSAADSGSVPRATRVTALELATGRSLFTRGLRGGFALALLDHELPPLAPQARPAVALFGPREIALLDRADGHTLWWRDYTDKQPATLTAAAVIVWDQGELVGLARGNGDVLWRVHFRLIGRKHRKI